MLMLIKAKTLSGPVLDQQHRILIINNHTVVTTPPDSPYFLILTLNPFASYFQLGPENSLAKDQGVIIYLERAASFDRLNFKLG